MYHGLQLYTLGHHQDGFDDDGDKNQDPNHGEDDVDNVYQVHLPLNHHHHRHHHQYHHHHHHHRQVLTPLHSRASRGHRMDPSVLLPL